MSTVPTDVFDDTTEDQVQDEPSQQQQQDPSQQQQQPPSVSEEVKRAVADAFKDHGPKQDQTPQKKEMTEEEKRKFWAIFDPEQVDPKFFHKFFNLGDDADDMTVAERKALFGKFQEGMMRQAVTAFKNMMDARFGELDQRLSPLQEHYSQQRAKQVREDFNSKYPQLSDKRFDALLRLSANALKDQEFDSQEAYFKALADNAVEAIRASGAEFSLDDPTKPKPAPGTAPKTSRSRVGGTGGTGSGAQPPAKTSRDDSDEIF